ncbi:F-box/WD repeat-containing protein 9 [Aplochiton taeniatus]
MDLQGNMGEEESGSERGVQPGQDEPVNLLNQQHPSEATRLELPGVPPGPLQISAESASSPSVEGSGLLSLPWEMVARIASHLPAQCVISVLPQVCHALGNVGRDSTAWQLRARRLTGSKSTFPLGPREDFDWPTACLEMEQLITCWAGQDEWSVRQAPEADSDGRREPQQHREVGHADEKEDGAGGVDEVDVGVAALELVFGQEEVREVALDGENGDRQLDRGEELPARAGEQRQEALEEGEVLEAVEGADGLHHELADPPGVADDYGQVAMEVEREGERPPSPCLPGAMERLSLPSGHIAEVDTVLLVGGEGAVCVSGSRDRNVNLWDLRQGSRGTLVRTLGSQGLFSTHQGWVWSLAARGPLLASGSFDSTVRLWDLEAGGAERGLIRTKAAVLCLACPSDDVLLVGTYDKKVCIYDTRDAGHLVKSLRLHSNAVHCLTADDQYIISASEDKTVVVYDRRAGKPLQKVRLRSYLKSISYSGSELWAGDKRGMLHTFSMQMGVLKPVSQLDVGHTSLVTGLHKSPGALYTSSLDRTLKVHLPCAPPRTLCTVRHQAGVNALSVDAGVLAVALGDLCVVWRARK